MLCLRLLPFAFLFIGQSVAQNKPPSTVHYQCSVPKKGGHKDNCPFEQSVWCNTVECKGQCRGTGWDVWGSNAVR
ncbi:uncharacterized protein RAG0_07145 [Rhynchosporium agropyri]|uniref:Uncharacterized protein n=1 Tax=Rhynchosporium agropyri TaxID=914238 RepID=A0A1E1KK00_9HELO|nr:uncharacterized protein RAG0_07145 [Rhynchosporium agropyri]